MSGKTTSAELYVLNKIVDLTVRCGLSPVDSEIEIYWNSGDCSYSVRGNDRTYPEGDSRTQKQNKLCSLLGLDGRGCRDFSGLHELDETVDKALLKIPPARRR
jgi:hypothetical protein